VVAKAKNRTQAGQKLLLATALLPTSAFQPEVQTGMGAFIAADRNLIVLDQRQRIGDSLDLDRAMRRNFPNENRWDYVFSVSDAKKLLALEPHSAKDGEIRVVIAKKRNAATELRRHLKPQHRVSEWLWVSHGRTSFSKTEKARRQLAQEGIRYVGRGLTTLG
jgi:hypothetical protein